jgi:hypothetical protein
VTRFGSEEKILFIGFRLSIGGKLSRALYGIEYSVDDGRVVDIHGGIQARTAAQSVPLYLTIMSRIDQNRNGLERTDIRAMRGGDGSARADYANAVAREGRGPDHLIFEKEKFKTCTLVLGIFARATCAM